MNPPHGPLKPTKHAQKGKNDILGDLKGVVLNTYESLLRCCSRNFWHITVHEFAFWWDPCDPRVYNKTKDDFIFKNIKFTKGN